MIGQILRPWSYPYVVSTLLVIAVLLGGCRLPFEGQAKEEKVSLSKEELGYRLSLFGDHFALLVQGAADTIHGLTLDRQVQRSTVVWKARAIPAVQAALRHKEPLSGFLDGWTYCVQMREFLQTGPGSEVFGERQQIAVEALKIAEQELMEIGSLFLNPEQLQRADEEVDEFVHENPMRGHYARRVKLPSMATKEETKDLMWVASLPLSPFKFSSLDASAKAIREFAAVGDQFVRTVNALPERVRWESDLLLYDVAEREIMTEWLDSVRLIGTASQEAVAVAKHLPTDVRTQVEATLDDLAHMQPELQATLRETRQTIQEARGAVEETTELAQHVERTASAVTEAGKAWEEMFRVIDGWVQKGPEADVATGTVEEKAGFAIKDYEATARAIQEAASEARSLIADARELSTSPELGEALDTLEERREVAVVRSEKALRRIIDYLFWRSVQFFLVVFVCTAFYRLIPLRKHKHVSAGRRTRLESQRDAEE